MPSAAQSLSAFAGTPAGSSAITGAAGAFSQGAAHYAAGSYNANIARNNESIANANADMATFRGNQEIGISRQRTAQMIGSERSGYGANGLDVNSGSAVRTQADTARLGEMDAQTIAQNAQRSAWGYRMQAATYGDQARLDRMGGTFDAFSSLVGGGSDFAKKWDAFKQAGVGGSNWGTDITGGGS